MPAVPVGNHALAKCGGIGVVRGQRQRAVHVPPRRRALAFAQVQPRARDEHVGIGGRRRGRPIQRVARGGEPVLAHPQEAGEQQRIGIRGLRGEQRVDAPPRRLHVVGAIGLNRASIAVRCAAASRLARPAPARRRR
jgi:hypothetical protein